ncbi:MAG: NAD(+) synthase [Promethearchaeota archaeon]
MGTSLEIKSKKTKDIIITKIKGAIAERKTSGLLVVFSGQLDSFTTAKIAIEAIGLESVKLIIISDVSESRRKEISSIATRMLNIPTKNIIGFNINKISRQIDVVEGLIPQIQSGIPVSRQHNINHLLLRTDLVRKIVEEKTYALVGESISDRDKFFQHVLAQSKVRKRLKILLAFLMAERENSLLVSKTNKTEWLTGLFTSFGYGHASDIMPLGDLYRTQVLQLAEYLNVPKKIRDLAYTDIMPGIQNKYQYFFEVESDDVDKVLIRLIAGWDQEKIAKDLDLPLDKIERINHFYQVSRFQRHLPIIPKINS